MQNKKWITALKMLSATIVLIMVLKMLSDKGILQSNQTRNTGEIESTYDFAMGTSIGVTLYDCKEQDLSKQIVNEIKNLDEAYISWRQVDSELYKINQAFSKSDNCEIEVSDMLYTAISETYQVCVDSEGALDYTIRPLANLWGIEDYKGTSDIEESENGKNSELSGKTNNSFQIPTKEAINDILTNIGYEKIVCDKKGEVTQNTIYNTKIGITIDLGASGKGYALDIVRELLQQSKVKGAVISVGGSILVYGSKDDNTNFKIGIRDPKGNIDEYIGYVELEPNSNVCISTSGDYEKYVEADGVKYHHILDAKTGAPADSGLCSVTIVCENGLYSDALSTACFVLGQEKSLLILKKYQAEALFIYKDGTIFMTDGMENLFVEN